MTSNPKSSPWYSTPRASRKRRGIELTLSPEAIERLRAMAPRGRTSEFVERLIDAEWQKKAGEE